MAIQLKKVDFINRINFPGGLVQSLSVGGPFEVELTFDAGLVRVKTPKDTHLVPAANVASMVEAPATPAEKKPEPKK